MFSLKTKLDFCNQIEEVYGEPYLSVNQNGNFYLTYGGIKQQDQFNSMTRYINGLFDYYSKLLFVRVDFKYKQDIPVSIDQADADLNHFLKNRWSTPLCRHLVGYIWKLEETSNEGIHYHFLFIFDNQKVQNEWYYAQNLGQYWVNVITRGRGTYYFNPPTHCTPFPATGSIHRNDLEKRLNLYNLLSYLCKAHQSLTNRPPRARVIGSGQLPK